MSPLQSVIYKKNKLIKPIWLMRQAGRYLPEFRKIRRKNPDFIKLCLNIRKVKEITLQPIKRYDLDAAIIFSDILMVPYGLEQTVEFKKNFGPSLGSINLDQIKKYPKLKFKKKLDPIYKSISLVSNDSLINKKDLIGFVGGPWTLLIYMLNKYSPKKKLNKILSDKSLILDMIKYISIFLEQHIKYQIKSGADIIQIFDSWAGLLEEKDLPNYVYAPTLNLVNYVKSLNVPVICFPREIKNYKEFCDIVKPDAVSIDYNVDLKKILRDIKIPIQGGLDPKVLLTDNENLKKEASNYLEAFKDHPYIFNLGHGILPETNPEMVQNLIKIIKDFK